MHNPYFSIVILPVALNLSCSVVVKTLLQICKSNLFNDTTPSVLPYEPSSYSIELWFSFALVPSVYCFFSLLFQEITEMLTQMQSHWCCGFSESTCPNNFNCNCGLCCISSLIVGACRWCTCLLKGKGFGKTPSGNGISRQRTQSCLLKSTLDLLWFKLFPYSFARRPAESPLLLLWIASCNLVFL